MIPISLSLQNFLSYGENVPRLDFAGFHVACISGPNGHGKSALLDAITWALWGEARKAGTERRANEGLLRIGATDMQVDFEFHLEGDRYRVSRSFRKTARSGTARLEFQIYSPETGGYKTLSEEGSIRKTQARIDALLRMNYDTFINSAFLLQGRADEFTRRNARERKIILADILGLSRYDDLSALARARAQASDLERATAQNKHAEIDAAVAQKPDVQNRLDAVTEKLAAAEQTLEASETRLENLREALTQTERRRAECEAAIADIKRIETERTDAQNQRDEARREVDACNQIIDQRDDILKAVSAHREYQAEETALGDKLHKLRPLETRKSELEREIDKARHEVERRLGEWEMRVADAEKELADAESLLRDREDIETRIEALKRARKQDREWETKREQRDLIERNIRDLERRVEAGRSERQVAINTRREQIRQAEARAATLPQRREALSAAQNQLAEIQALEIERDRIRDQGSALKVQIDTDRNQRETLQKNCADVTQQQTALEALHDTRCPLCGSNLDETHRAEVRAKLDQSLREHQMEIETLEKSIQSNESQREQFRRRYQEIKNQLTELEHISKTAAEAQAALQEAEAAEAKREQLQRELTDLEREQQTEEEANPDARALKEAQQELAAIAYDPAAHRTLRERLKEFEAVENRRAQLQVADERRQKARDALPKFREKRDLAKTWLKETRFASKEHEDLWEIQREIEALAYDPERHRQVSQSLSQYKDAPQRQSQLEAAERERQNAETRLKAAQTRLQTLETQRDQATQRQRQLEAAIAEGQQAETEAKTLQTSIREHRVERDKWIQERAGLQTQLARCETLEAERKEVQARIKAAERDIHIYRELTTAFGKDGIQALIIEQAIPEIEEEANRILSRLTDNRTQIALESLRDLKKGGTRETLDIKISDELGERSYELYSGGEAFRIDFAVRIALSRLLASRTGTRLRTLVIDEGFGTQDAQGIENLVEAIQAISEDFEKMLVITHVESLKQAFPVRVEITKYPDIGSRFEVLY